MDAGIALAGLVVGIVVGLTGMGGGALMTPVLVFFFRVDPLTAISSDVVSSLFMKPAGAIRASCRTASLELDAGCTSGRCQRRSSSTDGVVDHLRWSPTPSSCCSGSLRRAARGVRASHRSWFQMTRKRLP